MKIKNNKYIALIIFVIALITIGSIIGLTTQSSVDTWYKTLNRSSLTPPDYVFGIAWTMLYAIIATSGWLIWQAKSCPQTPLIKKLFIAQLLLNWIWAPIFFNYHAIDTALICLCLMIICVSMIILKTYKTIHIASLLLIPYLLWLLFAGHLNFYIWKHNKNIRYNSKLV